METGLLLKDLYLNFVLKDYKIASNAKISRRNKY